MSDRAFRTILSLAAFVVIIAGLKSAAPLIVPFLMAAFITLIAMPPIQWLTRYGLSRLLALGIVFISILFAGFGVAVMIGSSFDEFSSNIPAYQAKLAAISQNLFAWLGHQGLEIPDETIKNVLNPGSIFGLAGKLFGNLSGLLANGFLIFIAVGFMLAEAFSLPGKFRAATGDSGQAVIHSQTFIANLNKYIAIKTLTSLATGLVIALWLKIIGVDFPILWGLLAFLFNFVPNIGSVIAAVPAILLAFVQLGPIAALWTAVGFVAVNIIVGTILEPRIMGDRLGLSSFIVFVSLIFWGWVLGPIGMFLSVPLTMIVKIGLESSEHTRWAAMLLDSAVPETENETT